MTEPLTGTVALVTGASSGIGAATARHLAARGASVALLARRVDRLDRLQTELTNSGVAAFVAAADVADPAQCAAAVTETVDRFGRLDTVVNNAGLMRTGAAAEARLQDWDELVSVNINGVLYITRAALPHLIDAASTSPRRVADLVTISSTAGWVSRPGTAVYSLTKFGVNAFSEAVRQELVGHRVRVGVVGPGTVDTEIGDQLAPESRAAFEQRIADMVMLRAEDVADAVGYMVTRERHVAVNQMLVRAAEQTW